MKITDPRGLLDVINPDELNRLLGYQPMEQDEPLSQESFHYSEPFGEDIERETAMEQTTIPQKEEKEKQSETVPRGPSEDRGELIQGHVMRLGDFIDTDAVSQPICEGTVEMLIRNRLLRPNFWPLVGQTKNLGRIAWNSSCLNFGNKSKEAKTS